MLAQIVNGISSDERAIIVLAGLVIVWTTAAMYIKIAGYAARTNQRFLAAARNYKPRLLLQRYKILLPEGKGEIKLLEHPTTAANEETNESVRDQILAHFHDNL
jgi:hypothetical protein